MRQVPYYECHITVEADCITTKKSMQSALSEMSASGFASWTFSSIEDDIILGRETKLYATAHFDAIIAPTVHKGPRGRNIALLELDYAVAELQRRNFAVIRKKIECVVFDELVMKG